MAALHHQINDCIEKLKSGQLVEDDLRALLTSVDQRHRRKQSLLYIQTSSTRPEGEVVGMFKTIAKDAAKSRDPVNGALQKTRVTNDGAGSWAFLDEEKESV